MSRRYRILCALVIASPFAYAAEEQSICTSDANHISPGEKLTLQVCGDGITTDSQIRGFESAGIELLYRQDLRRCEPGDRRPGMLLEIQATAAARTTSIDIRDVTDKPICQHNLNVPELVLLDNATLTKLDQPDLYQLRLEDADWNLTDACGHISFAESHGPIIEQSGPASACEQNQLNATVRVTTGPQDAAQMLLTVQDNNGNNVDAISHIAPPIPFFANDMHESNARFVDVNGIRTRYFDKGTGDVLVLVHGGQPSAPDFNSWEWQQNFAELATRFRVIAPDRIGQGYTDNPDNLDDYENYYSLVVEHMLGFLDALELERVHLVGHSQGGWPVTRITLDHPERVRSLVIVDSTMVARAANVAPAVRFYMYHQNELHPQQGPSPQSVQRGLESFSYTNNNITAQRIDRILAISRTEKFQRASDKFDQLRMSPAHPAFRKLKDAIWEELQRGDLQTPTLIIWGREDPEGSFPSGVAMYESLQAAGSPVSFHPFDKAGHVAYMEYPHRFNQLISDFATAASSDPP